MAVHRVAVLSNPSHSPEEIARKHKHFTLADVHAALAYYHANREQVESEITSDREEAARLEAKFGRAFKVA
jgi:uncharacterized protein (DUF433 family)